VFSEDPFITLLLLNIDGERFGFSYCDQVGLESGEAGAPVLIQFVPGIVNIELPSRTVDPLSVSVSDGSSSVSLALGECDGLSSLLAGARMSESTGIVYCWEPGQTLADSYVAFSGTIRTASFDPSEGKFDFTLDIDIKKANPEFPMGKVGDAGRFVAPAVNNLQDPLPVVYGRVRRMAIPAIYLDNTTGAVTMCLAAHGVVGSPSAPGYVQIGTDPSGDMTTNYEIKTAVDGLGTSYSYIDISYADWDDSIYVVDMIGKPKAGTPGGLNRLGDVLIDLWRGASGIPLSQVDTLRVSEATGKLNGYGVGIGLNAAESGQTLFDILSTRIGGQFPVVFGSPNGRYGWDCVEFPLPSEPPFAHLIFGQNAFERGALVQSSATDIQNRFRLTYGVDGKTESDEKSLTLDETNSEMLRASQERYGKSQVASLSAPDVQDATSAGRILQSNARRLSGVRYRITYEAVGTMFLSAPLMAMVHVTDSDFGWDRKRFAIDSIEPVMDVGRSTVSLISVDTVAY